MSKGPILVIMAAGLGSRFGGNKQITPVDEHGQLIIDYSIYDAVRAGFETVVCVIKPENEKAFHDAIGARIAEFVDLKYAYQSLDMVPEGFVIPEGREKPWGTGHAAMCAKEYIDRPFAVINADDYYGRSAFETMAQYLMNATDPTEHVMVGYKVENTLTENGTVSRGQCMTKDGMLTSVIERTSIIPQEGGAAYTEDDGKTYTFIPAGTIVSMNMWGFMPSVVPKMEAYFKDFLRDLLPARPLKAEYYLPSIPNRMLEEGSGTVRVLETSEKWYGVTYREDLPRVKAAIAQMKAEGKYPDELWKKAEAKDIVKRFTTDSAIVTCERYGNGHINETYLAVSESGRRYILQKINNKVFQNVEGLMNNISSVTAYLAKNDPDPHHTLHLVPTQDGRCYTGNDIDGYWRLYDFVEDSICLEKVESKEDFYQSAVAFGMFQRQLAEFPAETLTETIVNFHNTADRVRQLKEAIANNKAGRLGEVGPEIEFALARAEEAGCMVKMLADGELPLRVTHNDTKLNNVMLDAVKRTPMCVIDLDTVMPGLAANDFGDSIRFGASTAAEDEKDLSKVEMSLELFEAYARGFLSACGSSLTEKEIETLPMGAKLMTYECGIRFLADYLNGDVYFRVHYPEHNLDRTRTQFKLVADMESKWDKMAEIIKKVAAETNGNC